MTSLRIAFRSLKLYLKVRRKGLDTEAIWSSITSNSKILETGGEESKKVWITHADIKTKKNRNFSWRMRLYWQQHEDWRPKSLPATLISKISRTWYYSDEFWVGIRDREKNIWRCKAGKLVFSEIIQNANQNSKRSIKLSKENSNLANVVRVRWHTSQVMVPHFCI